MTTLSISDLSHSAELDRNEMSAVRGGTLFLPSYSDYSTTLKFDTQQAIGQTQNVFNANGNNAAFVSDIDSKVKPVQKANNSNTINVFGGVPA